MTERSAGAPRGGALVCATASLALGLPALALSAAAVVQTVRAEAHAGVTPVAALVGIGLFVLWIGCRRRRRLLELLAWLAATLAALMVGVAVVAGMLTGSGDRVGSATPFGLMAGLLWTTVCAATVGEIRTGPPVLRPAFRSGSVIVAVLFGVALLCASIGPLERQVTAAANTISVLSVDTVPATPARSALTGERRWTRTVPGASGLVPSAAGLAVPVDAVGDDPAGIVMIDASTGRVRWSYRLRGVELAPDVAAADSGRRLIVRWPNDGQLPGLGYLTLAASTGRPLTVWSAAYTDDDLESADPTVVRHTVGRGSDSVARLAADGGELWRYSPGRCKNLSADATVGIVVVDVDSDCGGSSQEVGLDAATGRTRWQQPISRPPVGSVMLRTTRIEVTDSRLQARDLRTGSVVWSRPLTEAGASCIASTPQLTASAGLVLVTSCSADAGSQPAGSLIQAYRPGDGVPLWRRTLTGRTVLGTTRDGDRAVILTGGDSAGTGDEGCRLDLVGRSGSRTVTTLPTPDGSACSGDLQQIGGEYVLIADAPSGLQLIALA